MFTVNLIRGNRELNLISLARKMKGANFTGPMHVRLSYAVIYD